MPAAQGAPAWARELALAYESGAHGQFVLYGNVHDRLPVGERAGQPRRATSRTSCSPAFHVVLRLRPRQRPPRRARRRRWWSSGAARRAQAAARASRCRRSTASAAICATSATCARSAATRSRARRRHPARRRPDPAGRRRRLRARQPHQPAARVGRRGAVLRPAVREHPDRRQPQRRRAAGRLQRRASTRIDVPLPDAAALSAALTLLPRDAADGLRRRTPTPRGMAAALVGVTVVGAREPGARCAPTTASRSAPADLGRDQEGAGRARLRRPRRVHRVAPHARRLPRPARRSRPGCAQDIALWRAGDLQGAAEGLSAVRPGRHRQDLPRRVPRRRGRRAGREAEELPRPLGRLERGQPGEDLPPRARARPLHGVHRRGRPDARPARVGQRRQRPLGTPLLDDRAGDGRHRPTAAGWCGSSPRRAPT